MRKLYSILCATLIGILFTTTAWADVMSSHDDTFGERLLNFDVSTTTLIVLSYIFFAFIAFWVLFPFYRKTKKKLLAISLIFPILVFVPPFIVWTNDYLHELWDNNYKLVIILLVPFFFLYALYALFAKKRKRLLIRLVYIFLYILFLVIFNYADEMVDWKFADGGCRRIRREFYHIPVDEIRDINTYEI